MKSDHHRDALAWCNKKEQKSILYSTRLLTFVHLFTHRLRLFHNNFSRLIMMDTLEFIDLTYTRQTESSYSLLLSHTDTHNQHAHEANTCNGIP